MKTELWVLLEDVSNAFGIHPEDIEAECFVSTELPMDEVRELRSELAAANAKLGQLTKVLDCEATRLPVRGFYVYKLRDQNDKIIYVGQSSNVLARLGRHVTDQSKRNRVRSVEVIKCSSRKDMVRAEAELIRHLQPELNVMLL